VRLLSAVVFGIVLSLLPRGAGATSRERHADELLRDARARIAVGTPEQRQFARGLLEDAHRLVPDDAEISHALARLYLEADMLFAARRLAKACIERDPRDAEAHFLLGEMWRREWILRSEDVTRDRAIVSLARGLRISPGDPARAQLLVPMLEDAHERRSALEVAELAARARPKDPESLLLVGYAAQNAGELTLADQMYQRALPMLDVERRRRYEDLSPLLGEAAAIPYRRLKAAERARFNASFWHGNDPDPTTPEHEAQVEFWARVTHSDLLFGMNELGVWDLRAQLYIRYGAPRRVDRSLVTSSVSTQVSTWAAWSYPELGMRIWIPALNPLGHYGSRFGLSNQPWVRASPDSLLAHPELQSMQGGYAVFRRLPPDTELMPLRTAVVRFDGGAGAVLLAQAEVESAPAGRLHARWVLLDSASTVVASTTSDVGASACEPSSMRAASFATNAAPGRSRLAVRVDDETGRCAVATQDVVIAEPRSSRGERPRRGLRQSRDQHRPGQRRAAGAQHGPAAAERRRAARLSRDLPPEAGPGRGERVRIRLHGASGRARSPLVARTGHRPALDDRSHRRHPARARRERPAPPVLHRPRSGTSAGSVPDGGERHRPPLGRQHGHSGRVHPPLSSDQRGSGSRSDQPAELELHLTVAAVRAQREHDLAPFHPEPRTLAQQVARHGLHTIHRDERLAVFTPADAAGEPGSTSFTSMSPRSPISNDTPVMSQSNGSPKRWFGTKYIRFPT
jgi:GWxTD domain-containing protein